MGSARLRPGSDELIFGFLDALQSDPAVALLSIAVVCASLAVGITVHEFSHAWVATSLGDGTARALGRLSLNPARHLDPVGSALLLLAGFGWGKPVPVNTMYLRVGARPGMALVSLAGPASNVVAAVVFGIVLRLGAPGAVAAGFSVWGIEGEYLVRLALVSLVRLNLVLAVLNLIPIAPLDGFKVALGLLPPDAARSFARLESYGPVILLAVIVMEYLPGNLGVLSSVIRPVVNALSAVILGESVL